MENPANLSNTEHPANQSNIEHLGKPEHRGTSGKPEQHGTSGLPHVPCCSGLPDVHLRRRHPEVAERAEGAVRLQGHDVGRLRGLAQSAGEGTSRPRASVTPQSLVNRAAT